MPYDKNNIFAKILRGEIPCKKIYENDELPKILDLLKTQEIYLPISAIIFLFVLTFILRKFFFKK